MVSQGRSHLFGLFFSVSVLVLCLFFFPALGEAATIRAELDRNPVSIDESFTLVFEAEGKLDDNPNFSALGKDFDLLRQSEGSSMQIINGEVSRKQQWTLVLMAKTTGRFTIPAIAFGKDSSPSLAIEVKAAATANAKGGTDGEPLFIEVFAEPQLAYVQAQVIYTARLYRSVNLMNGSLSEPTLSDADAVIEKLGEDRAFETTRNGQKYVVVERVYAIFPQQSGQLRVEPLTFEGQIAGRSRSMLEPFGSGGAMKRLRSEAIELDVRPVPQDKVKGRWLPARDLRIFEAGPEHGTKSNLIKAGEPMTRTLILVAEGLTAAQLPEIPFDLPEGFKAYPDQPVFEDKKQGGGLIGVRQEKVALIPTRPGSYVLPAIEIPWWNTTTNRAAVARLEARPIEVAPAALVKPPPSGALPEGAASLEQKTEGPVLPASGKGGGFWSLISLVLGLGWALTLVAWWGSRQKTHPAQSAMQDLLLPSETGAIQKQLKKACMQNAAEAAKEALLAWSRALWPQRTQSLGEVRHRVGLDLSREIQKLNTSLYSREPDAWQGGPALWAAFEQEIKKEKIKSVRKAEGLAPMVP